MPALRRLVLRLHARHVWHAYLFVAPIIILFGAFRVAPSIQTLLYSVYRVELLRGRFTFIGLDNFRELLVDRAFQQAAWNTLVYVLVIVPVSAALGLLLAVLFDTRFPLRELFKALYFAPMVTSTVAAAVVWWWLYNPQFGLFNALLRLVGLPVQPWLMSSRTALFSIILFSVWKGVGYNMIVYLAGLQAIPESFIEAARIDGAGAFQRFRRITLPLLAPTTAFLLIYNSIQAFQVFDQVFVLVKPRPTDATITIVYFIYENGFKFFKMGLASAASWVLFLIIALFTAIYFWSQDRWVHYQ